MPSMVNVWFEDSMKNIRCAGHCPCSLSTAAALLDFSGNGRLCLLSRVVWYDGELHNRGHLFVNGLNNSFSFTRSGLRW